MTRARKTTAKKTRTKKPEIYITLAGLKKIGACVMAQRTWSKAFRNKRVTLNRTNLRILYRQRAKYVKDLGNFNSWILVNRWINWLRGTTTKDGNAYYGNNEPTCLDNLARLRRGIKNPIK